jgi:hypothetical protein
MRPSSYVWKEKEKEKQKKKKKIFASMISCVIFGSISAKIPDVLVHSFDLALAYA